jgi:hypothetical protein
MIPAPSYKLICEDLVNHFIDRSRACPRISSSSGVLYDLSPFRAYSDIEKTESRFNTDNVKMVCILFVQSSHKIAKDEILPNLTYYHYRTGKNVNFYLAGYGASWKDDDDPDDAIVCRVDSADWFFSWAAFNKLRQELEDRTTWRYSGECDLVIVNAKMEPLSEKVILDFSSCIAVNLNELRRTNSIPSVMNFFETIFRYAEVQDSTDPTWGLSDSLGISSSMSTLKCVVLSLLPKNIGKEVEKISHFAVMDVSKKKSLE